MTLHVEISKLGEHEYLARVEEGHDSAEVWFSVDPATLDDFGVADIDERQVVEQTMRFLAQHQPVIDFPQMADLGDVAAAYADYPQVLRELLAP